ncbi:hypothetical protein N7462_007277 [Penicillium macrosclerotiorum]|uniref:uncharacterized protein n=1 Tax=Penicillium macrosclerotiorum TaxID=303699 RepID=UPI002547157F|nr:uncharacterized protein N7462_007277 [Penicillium macrosclerotiorum]KAJ5679033.1 hypothetical protein N7462_007277 [Penicillium macrosclerotiorum]
MRFTLFALFVSLAVVVLATPGAEVKREAAPETDNLIDLGSTGANQYNGQGEGIVGVEGLGVGL